MRLPRFTTRRLMVLVAGVAVAMAFVARVQLPQRRDHFLRLAAIHEREWTGMGMFRYDSGTRNWFLTTKARKDHEAALKAKYERAARYPWLPVPPDPPPPQ